MTNPITNSEDVIDSRDILDRIDDLAGDESRTDEQERELASLRRVEAQAYTYGDWRHGETLIRESYFVEYTRELIADCYSEIEKTLSEGSWPARHLTLDYAAAARELEQDYTEIDFGGVTYLMRA